MLKCQLSRSVSLVSNVFASYANGPEINTHLREVFPLPLIQSVTGERMCTKYRLTVSGMIDQEQYGKVTYCLDITQAVYHGNKALNQTKSNIGGIVAN